MYFPTLNILKNYHQIDSFIISKLDVWLGTRRKAVKNFLSPIQFSIDTDIDEDLSITLFANCTNPKIRLLRQRYVVECPHCNAIIGVYYAPSDVPLKAHCIECNDNFNVTFDNITIWFELLKFPEYLPEHIVKNNFQQEDNSSGKI